MAISKYLRIPQYEAGGYPKDKTEKVQALFSKAFGGRTESIEMLRWQMEENPCLEERATSLWDGDVLVAYNALTPAPAFINGRGGIVAVSGTTMADEHYPGCSLQLFTECAKQNPDVDMVIGFPNHNSYGITVKYLGHHYVGDVAFWTAKAVPSDHSERIKEFSEFSAEYEEVSKALSKTHELIKSRQKDYLDWRFFRKPEFDYRGFEYEKRGYIVVDVYVDNGQRQLQLVDIIADSDEVMSELLRFSVDLADKWGCRIVKLWLTSERYSGLLKENGFEYGEHPFAMTVWDRDIDISKSYITMADSDIF